MAEDDSTQPPERRTWLDRIGSMLSGEPSTREDLVELLRDAQSDGLIAADTLRMMEGALSVAELTVGDVMISRSQIERQLGTAIDLTPIANSFSEIERALV